MLIPQAFIYYDELRPYIVFYMRIGFQLDFIPNTTSGYVSATSMKVLMLFTVFCDNLSFR